MSLKVFDLQCGNGHVFEGWFSASKGFEEQLAQGLLDCPVCGDDTIERKLSAPRLNLGSKDAEQEMTAQQRDGGEVPSDHEPAVMASPDLARLQAELLRHMRNTIKNSEDVGSRFAQEALKIHNGEAQERAIKGTVTPEERRELADEGISVIPVPDFLDDDRLQ